MPTRASPFRRCSVRRWTRNGRIRRAFPFRPSFFAVVAPPRYRSSSRHPAGKEGVYMAGHARFRNDRRDYRKGGRRAARSNGDARILWLYMGDYFAHWLKMAALCSIPRSLRVNWFRARRARPVHLAGIRREHGVCCNGSSTGLGAHARRGRNIAWPDAAVTRTSIGRDWKSSRPRGTRTRPGGRRGVEGRARLARRAFRQLGKRLPAALEAGRGRMHQKLAA